MYIIYENVNQHWKGNDKWFIIIVPRVVVSIAAEHGGCFVPYISSLWWLHDCLFFLSNFTFTETENGVLVHNGNYVIAGCIVGCGHDTRFAKFGLCDSTCSKSKELCTLLALSCISVGSVSAELTQKRFSTKHKGNVCRMVALWHALHSGPQITRLIACYQAVPCQTSPLQHLMDASHRKKDKIS